MNLKNPKARLTQYCEDALRLAYPDKSQALSLEKISITEATKEQFGHYQCNSAMKLTNILNEKPRAIAEKMAATLQTFPNFTQEIAKLEVAGPGFLNFTFSPQFISEYLNQQLKDPRLGVPEKPIQHFNESIKQRVVVEFSSPNVAKEMHVGHIRSTIIGDSLANILTFTGHDVLRLNHVGDWGTQFGMLIAYIKTNYPQMTKEEAISNIHLGELVKWYKASKQQFDEDNDFKKLAQLEVVRLQSGDTEAKRIWEEICEISRRAYNEIYDLLDINIIERGESFYNPLLPKIVDMFTKKGLITISDGAKCVFLEGFKNRDGNPLPLIIQKADGGYNYATTDLAALYHRIHDEKRNWIIYVVDAGQSLHFQMMFEAAKLAGFYDPTLVRVDHVPFGLVLKSDGTKFKTRSGDTERLVDLLNTAIQKSKTILEERNRDENNKTNTKDNGHDTKKLSDNAHILGINAVKYADLSCHRLSDYIFNYDKMLKFEGNTAAFLMYAYVRILSIQRKVNVNIEQLLQSNTQIVLKEPAELTLGLLAARFGEMIEATERELLPNRITDYLYTLAEKFHAFFHQCRVDGSPEQNSRILLTEIVLRILRQGFLLLGLKPLERM